MSAPLVHRVTAARLPVGQILDTAAWRHGEALRDALARADHAQYKAEASGRDRLV